MTHQSIPNFKKQKFQSMFVKDLFLIGEDFTDTYYSTDN